jgi:hypothetical protein
MTTMKKKNAEAFKEAPPQIVSTKNPTTDADDPRTAPSSLPGSGLTPARADVIFFKRARTNEIGQKLATPLIQESAGQVAHREHVAKVTYLEGEGREADVIVFKRRNQPTTTQEK